MSLFTKHQILLNISLICSIQALDTWNSVPQKSDYLFAEDSFLQDLSSSEQTKSFVNILCNIYTYPILYDLTLQLSQSLRMKENTYSLGPDLSEAFIGTDLLKQYLRKFNFFYRYYFVKIYPNDFATLSIKKTNMMAIKSLFFIQSI